MQSHSDQFKWYFTQIPLSLLIRIRLVNRRHYESFCWSVCGVRSGSGGTWYVLSLSLFTPCIRCVFAIFCITISEKKCISVFVFQGSSIKCYGCKDYSGECSKIRNCYYDDACVTVYERGASSLILRK